MKLFFLNRNPLSLASELCDLHVYKQSIDVAQILSSAAPSHGLTASQMYTPICPDNIYVKWAAQNMHNYMWLVGYGTALIDEASMRFHLTVPSANIIWAIMESKVSQDFVRGLPRRGGDPVPNNRYLEHSTEPPLEMPEYYQLLSQHRMEEVANAGDDIDSIYTKWMNVEDISKEYYSFEIATKPWGTWSLDRGVPYWVQTKKQNLKSWWNTLETEQKIKIPKSIVALEKLISLHDPLGYTPQLQQDISAKTAGSLTPIPAAPAAVAEGTGPRWIIPDWD